MMEKSYTSEGHCNIVFVTCHDNMVVSYRTTGLRNVFHTALVCSLYIITEGEKGIAAQTHSCVLCHPIAGLLFCKGFGTCGEELLPGTVLQDISSLGTDVKVYGVVTVSAADTFDER